MRPYFEEVPSLSKASSVHLLYQFTTSVQNNFAGEKKALLAMEFGEGEMYLGAD